MNCQLFKICQLSWHAHVGSFNFLRLRSTIINVKFQVSIMMYSKHFIYFLFVCVCMCVCVGGGEGGTKFRVC